MSAFHVFVDGSYRGCVRAASADNCVRRFLPLASKSVNVLRSPQVDREPVQLKELVNPILKGKSEI